MQAAGIPLPHSEEAWQQALHALKVGGRAHALLCNARATVAPLAPSQYPQPV